jgi:hypothetical protein
LGLEHLLQPEDHGLDLGFLAAERHGAAGPGGQEEKAALAWVPDRGHGDAIDRVQLEDRHGFSLAESFDAAVMGKKLK